jgi:gamma-glutamylcyclotransferase
MANYFCYSSALDLDSLNIWKNQHGYGNFELPVGKKAAAQNVKLCCDFQSKFWGGRVLSLEDSAGSQVEGIVFEILNASDWKIIEHKEGVMTGVSQIKMIEVKVDEKMVQAQAFVTNEARKSTDGALSQNFLAAVERAYLKWNLKTDVLKELK